MAIRKQSKTHNHTSTKKGISKQELSARESKLLECIKKNQPVLLYGKDTVGRENLIRKFHLENDGIDSPWEFVGCGVKIQSMDDVDNEMLKAIKDENLERAKNLYNKRESTAKTLMCLNWRGMDGSGVRNKLISKQSSPNFKLEIITEYIADKTREFCFKQIFSNYFDRCRKLIEREGTLFIDNLSCYEKDKRSYEQIATIIEKRYEDTTSSIWLICYVHNIENFPDPFIELFEPIPIGDENKNTVVTPNARETEAGVLLEKEVAPKNNKKTNSAKLRGTKKHYAAPETKEKLIKKYLKDFPEETRHVIALKVNKSLKEKGGRPLEITTLKKDISLYKNQKKKK